jgi:hypothetical protein
VTAKIELRSNRAPCLPSIGQPVSRVEKVAANFRPRATKMPSETSPRLATFLVTRVTRIVSTTTPGQPDAEDDIVP